MAKAIGRYAGELHRVHRTGDMEQQAALRVRGERIVSHIAAGACAGDSPADSTTSRSAGAFHARACTTRT